MCLSLSLGFATSGRAEMDVLDGTATMSGFIDVGVQQKDVRGSDEKFEEYRDVRNGFLLNDFILKIDSKTTPYYLDIKIKNPLQDNEFYRVKGGRHGKLKLDIQYDKILHNFSTGRLLLSGAGSGDLVISDVVQSSLQSVEQTRQERGPNPLIDTTGEDSLAQGIVNGLYSAADTTVFKLKREKAGASLEYEITRDIKSWVKVTNEKRDGTRVITTGTYERFSQGASGLDHTADLFLVSGTELGEPIDYQTTTLTAGIGVYKANWLADLEYTFTQFDNDIQSLRWDNPFRTDDAAATTATDGVGNAFNRGRFARGQIALPPDSQSHTLNLSGGVDLPLNSRLSGTIGYDLVTQDEQFLPYTLNSALSSVAGFDVTNPALLPKSNLDGEVKTLNQGYVLTSRPVAPLTVTAKYRYYDYDNKSEQILFPGYAGFGESFWRTVKNDKNAPVENEPQSYTRQNADLAVSYKVAAPLTVKAEGGWEGWKREHRFVEDTDEWSIGGSVTYRPFAMANLRVGYKYSDRSTSEYEPGATAANPEAIGLTDFDLAERKRNKVDAQCQLTPHDSLVLSAFFQYMDDKYGEDTRFGLKKARNTGGGLDVTYTPSEVVTLYASYSRENIENKMQSGSKDDPFNNPTTNIDDAFAADNFNPLNYWNTDIDEDIDTVGVGATVQLMPGRLILDTSYNFSYSSMDFSTFNPNGTVKLANAAAQDWGKVKNRHHQLKADLGYKITNNLKAGIRYLYEKYNLDDFAWDNMNTYMAGLSAENSTKFLFTNAKYKGYEAHVGGVYLTYKF